MHGYGNTGNVMGEEGRAVYFGFVCLLMGALKIYLPARTRG
jgi:hypothetical protein